MSTIVPFVPVSFLTSMTLLLTVVISMPTLDGTRRLGKGREGGVRAQHRIVRT
jgi:hypothetical protein